MGSITPSKWTPQTVLVISTLSHPPEEHTTSPVPFFHLLERLKTSKREGWRQAGLSNTESISDHMYRMSIMTMFAPPSLSSQLNTPRCIKMALIHDMAELLVGDLTPRNNVPKPEKAEREVDTMEYITSSLLGCVPGGLQSGEEMLELFQEYEANTTIEAQFVHDIDKMEMLLQNLEYERRYGVDLTEFYHVFDKIHLPEIKEWASIVIRERKELKGAAVNRT